jgi:ribose transport system ATP-binding protein
MSHRIIVMCEGRITGELLGTEATQEKIMKFATQRGVIVNHDDAAPNQTLAGGVS